MRRTAFVTAIYTMIAACFFLTSLSFAASSLIVEPDDGTEPILSAIQAAHSTVDLAIYGFTDESLMQAFIQAKEAGKKVRILLQHYPYIYTNENSLAIQRFSAAHLNVVFAPPIYFLLHQKTLILDHQLALVLTFNFTHSTFKKERNFGLRIDDPQQVEEIQRVFDADWQNKSSKPSNPHLVWSPDNSRQKILALIDSAKAEIKIYAQGLSDYQVVGALAKAARKGVVVRLLSSGAQSAGKRDYLRKAGVKIRLDKKLMIHAKVLIVDQEKAMLGSINFTQPSIDKNRELAVLIDDRKVIQELSKVFESDWQVSRDG